MLKRVFSHGVVRQPWRMIVHRPSSSTTASSSAVNSILLRSLKEQYLEVSKMSPPPKVSPPEPFTIAKGALDSNGPVLKRIFGKEEISISVMRMTNIVSADGDGDGDDDDSGMNQLFVHVDVSKPDQKDSLHFLCGLYPDALGVHSVSMRPKLDMSKPHALSRYTGPVFEELDERMKDGFYGFIEERGINESLFPFLQAWLYVKDHRLLMRWFKTVGTYINEDKPSKAS